jgi:hypothetical protein
MPRETLTIETLGKSPAAIKLFQAFDLDLSDVTPAGWYRVTGCDRTAVFGRNGSGSQYLLCNPAGDVLFVSSEGAAGVIAEGLTQAVALVVSLPYWETILAQSNGGDLELMRVLAARLEEEAVEEEPELDDMRSAVFTNFGVPTRSDPVGDLHRVATRRMPYSVLSAHDGSELVNFFGDNRPRPSRP